MSKRKSVMFPEPKLHQANRPNCWLILLLLLLTVSSRPISASPPDPLANDRVDTISAPDSVLVDMQGRERRVVSTSGRPSVINFWATWCGPCRHEMPALGKLAKALGATHDMVGVNVGDDAVDVARFIEITPIHFPILLDAEQRETPKWPVLGLPTTVLIDARGQITHVIQGIRDWDTPEMAAAVRSLTGAPAN